MKTKQNKYEVKRANETFDKRIKQKPIYTKDGHVACPYCHKIIHATPTHCDCGQALNWEGC